MSAPKRPRGEVVWLRPPPPPPPAEVREAAFAEVVARARALGLTR